MPLSVPELWNTIVDAGLANAATARHWATSCATANGGSFPSDVKVVAVWLVKAGHLTEFQARALLADRSDSLRRGPWIVCEPQAPAPLTRWFVGQNKGQLEKSLVYSLPRQDAASLNGKMRKQLAAKSQHLLSFDFSADDQGEYWLRTQLPEGLSLNQRLARGPLDAAETLRLAQHLSEALAELHRHGIVAEVHADRVWLDASGSFLLLCDLAHLPGNPLTKNLVQGSFDPITELPLTAFAAPEFAIPGTVPNPATNVYALGCLLYLARYGELPFRAHDTDQWVRAHSTSWPVRLAAHGSDPIDKLIAHCLAKNLNARFNSADAVSQAAAGIQQFLARPPATLPAAKPSPASVTAVAPPPLPKSRAAVSAASRESVAVPESGGTKRASPPPPPRPAPAKSQPTVTKKSKPVPETVTADSRAASNVPKAAPAPSIVQSPLPSANIPPVATTPPGSNPPTSSGPAASPNASQPIIVVPPVAPPPIPVTEPVSAPPVHALPTEPVKGPTATAPLAAPPTTPTPPTVPTSPTIPVPTPAPIAATAPAPAAVAAPTAAASGTAPAGKGSKPRKRVKKKKQNFGPIIIGAVGFALIMIFIAVLMSNRTRNERERIAAEKARELELPPPPLAPLPSVNTAPQVAEDGVTELSDDPKSLWAPPGKNDEILLEMVPAGAQTVLMLRPARLLNSGEGRTLLSAFDPELSAAFERLQSRSGVSAGQIDRLFVAVEEGSSGQPIYSLAVKLVTGQPLATLRGLWGKVQPAQTEGNQVLFVSDDPQGDAYYVAEQPPNDASVIEQFAVGPVASMKRVAELEGTPVPLPTSARQLWDSVREGHDLAFLVNPNLLFAGGREMLKENAPRLVEPLKSLLIPDVSAGLVTMTFTPNWFAEVRITPGGGAGVVEVLSRLQKTIDELPQQAESFLLDSRPHDSWRALALRMPQMLRAAASATRIRPVDQQAVANVYLPQAAAANILLSGWLAANTSAGASTVAVVAAPTKPLTFDELLERKINVDIAQEDMHAAVTVIQDLTNEDVPPGSEKISIRLVGNDLEKAGITQNQSLRDFTQRGVSLRQVLTALCLKAHTPTQTDPKNPAQKLVWALGPDPDNPGKKVVLITTRVAAEQNYELAKEFVAAPSP